MSNEFLRVGMLALCTLGSLTSVCVGQETAEGPEQLVAQNLLGLVHAPEVHQELHLSPAQVTGLEAFFQTVDGAWFRARNLPAAERRAKIKSIETLLDPWMRENFSAAQRKRLKQLEYRSQGTRMLLRTDLAQQLGLSNRQQSQLLKLARATDAATEALREATMANSASEAEKTAVLEATQAEQKSIQEVVTQEQLHQLSTILGQPFDTTQLSRIYPLAPELIPVEDWINSEPLTLAGLRGKVVVVHFYAFQCHNCHANFDHYRKWHDEFGDEVVVLGIQTPETPRERETAAVREAAESRGLDFPILVDLKSENWAAWANTMWPTVYIIDKNGYVRQWWQGELNWNGATGDQRLHQLINDLLQEKVGV